MRALRPHVRVALAVPGQGSQAVGMGKALHAEYPAARAVFDRVEATLKISLKKAMFEGPKEQLTRTSFAQPAILTHSVAAFEAYKVLVSPSSTADLPQAELKEPKVQNIAKVALGHSVGEIAALCIAGAIELEDAARLLVRIPSPLLRSRNQHVRGEAMQKAVPSGSAMAALMPMDEATAAKICAEAEKETGKIVDVASTDSLLRLFLVLTPHTRCQLVGAGGDQR